MFMYALVGSMELLQDLYLSQNLSHAIELYTALKHVLFLDHCHC